MPDFDEEMNDLFIDEDVDTEEAPTVEEPVEEPAAEKEPQDPSVKNEVQLAKDFVELRKSHPELSSMDDIENPERFMRLRNNGCTIEEAFLATGGSKKRIAAGSGKEHLHTVAPKGTAAGEHVTRSEIEAARELLNDPKLTDKDLAAYVRRARS